ncbi:uncharacterized protein LOC9645062 [Selaginella moellendorffii]|uniref:uncharacterized protein LOC9645062 n=1 Tax=Selaginella moellendorffii TaxID=88036 RepID=UPI000D1CBC63|nr:uncharacterized protein LOC9645062 [Selaginella moellendorffii]|eukprot:XP_024545091.1 uncharacterized protein LOC9645062 [Selaginella moellendorffii]
MASSHSTTKRLFHGKAAAFPTLLIDEANRFHEWSLCPKEQHHLRNLQDYFLMLTKETNTANVILCSSEDIRRVAGTCEQASWRLEKEAFLSSVLFDVETMSQVSGSRAVEGARSILDLRRSTRRSVGCIEREKIRRKDTHFSLFLVSRPTFWRIINSRDTGSFSPVPYACTLLNCLLWFFYGLPAVTSNNTLIVTINAAGIILECIYLIVFFTFAPAAHRVSAAKILFYALLLCPVSRRPKAKEGKEEMFLISLASCSRDISACCSLVWRDSSLPPSQSLSQHSSRSKGPNSSVRCVWWSGLSCTPRHFQSWYQSYSSSQKNRREL